MTYILKLLLYENRDMAAGILSLDSRDRRGSLKHIP